MSRDIRNYRRQTIIRLIVGGILLLYTVGIGLIYLIYGKSAAISGLICLSLGMVPLAAILIFFWIIDVILARSRDD